MSGVLYTVATPIGNLCDISQRAIETLKNVDLIICEDTRTSAVLLERYGITTSLMSYHKFNEHSRCDEIISLLSEGKNVALISDAGTPCVSDPGCVLIEEVYKNNLTVTPIPGACAVATLLSALPRTCEEFAFGGFFPRKFEEQKSVLEKFSSLNTIFYESPKRLVKTLNNIAEISGKDTKLAIGRELTKKFEEIKIDTAENFIEFYSANPPKGEIAMLVYAKENASNEDEAQLLLRIKKLKAKNFSDKEISIILSQLFDYPKNKVYTTSLAIKD